MGKTTIGYIPRKDGTPCLGWPVLRVDVWDDYTQIRFPVVGFMWDGHKNRIIPVHGRPADPPYLQLYLEDMSNVIKTLYRGYGRWIIGFNVTQITHGELKSYIEYDPRKIKDNDPDLVSIFPITYPMVHTKVESCWIRVYRIDSDILMQYNGSNNFKDAGYGVDNYIDSILGISQNPPERCKEIPGRPSMSLIPQALKDLMMQQFTRPERRWRNTP